MRTLKNKTDLNIFNLPITPTLSYYFFKVILFCKIIPIANYYFHNIYGLNNILKIITTTYKVLNKIYLRP